MLKAAFMTGRGPAVTSEHDNTLYAAIAEQVQQLHGVEVTDEVIETILAGITRSAVDAIPGAAHAGIVLVDNGQLVGVAATDAVTARIDDLQATHHMGPCLTAACKQRRISVADYSTDTRWAAYTADVLACTPVRSTMSFQLYRTPTSMGALSIHANHPRAFDRGDTVVGSTFATLAALALQSDLREQQFQQALASRDIIGQAKGVLMHKYSVNADRAFDMLSTLSQENNTRVAELAHRVVVELSATPPT